jgi:hypothetical protein
MARQSNRKKAQKTVSASTKDSTGSPDFVSIRHLTFEQRQRLQVTSESHWYHDTWSYAAEGKGVKRRAVTVSYKNYRLLDKSSLTAPDNWRHLDWLRCYMHVMFTQPFPCGPKLPTVISCIRRGPVWLLRYVAHQGIRSVSEMTATDWSSFLDWIADVPSASGGKITNRLLRSRVKGIDWVWKQRNELPDGPKVYPWGRFQNANEWIRSACEEVVPRGANRTIEMPDEIACALFSGSLKLLREGMPRVLAVTAARQKYRPIRKLVRVGKSGTQQKLVITNPFQWEEWGFRDGFEFRSYKADMEAAAMALVGLLTGMRAHEIIAIPSSIAEAWVAMPVEFGNFRETFYFVRTKTSKLEPQPTSLLWQTVPLLREVLEVVLALNAKEITGGSKWLFASKICRGKDQDESKVSNGISVKLKRLAKRLCLPWPQIATHQLRKKFSRIVVRQGMDLIDLQVQLKHFDIEMTRVYGDPNLYGELQTEKFELSQELYREIVTSKEPVGGGGRHEIRKLRIQFAGIVVANREEFLASLAQKTMISVVDEGYCLYNASRALCGGNSQACRPDLCENSVVPLESMRRMLSLRRDGNKRLLKRFRGHPMKSAALIHQINMIDGLLRQGLEVVG